MKYAVFTKKIGELDVSDFDEEVLNQYENLTLRKEGLSYTVDGQEVITTTDNLIQDMCERQIEFIFNDFAERVAKKIASKRETPPKMKQVMIPKYCIVTSDDAVSSTKAVPTAEPKRGKWIHGKEVSRDYIGDACVRILYEDWHCSSCRIVVKEPCKPNWNYCPHCGAKMESDEE